MKVYVVYTRLNEYDYHNSNMYFGGSGVRFDDETDKWIILYAHTNEKKILKKFLLIHSDIFMVRVHHMTDDEYRKFSLKYRGAKITLYDFRYEYDEKVVIKLPVTYNEINNLLEGDDNGSTIYYNDFAPLAKIDPFIFNKKISRYLDDSFYTEDYIRFYGSDSDLEVLEWNKSFYPPDKTRVFNEIALLCLEYPKFISIKGIHQYMIEVIKNEKS